MVECNKACDSCFVENKVSLLGDQIIRILEGSLSLKQTFQKVMNGQICLYKGDIRYNTIHLGGNILAKIFIIYSKL